MNEACYIDSLRCSGRVEKRKIRSSPFTIYPFINAVYLTVLRDASVSLFKLDEHEQLTVLFHFSHDIHYSKKKEKKKMKRSTI